MDRSLVQLCRVGCVVIGPIFRTGPTKKMSTAGSEKKSIQMQGRERRGEKEPQTNTQCYNHFSSQIKLGSNEVGEGRGKGCGVERSQKERGEQQHGVLE